MAKKTPLKDFKKSCFFEDGKDGIPIDFNNPEHIQKLTDRLIKAVKPYGYVYAGDKEPDESACGELV